MMIVLYFFEVSSGQTKRIPRDKQVIVNSIEGHRTEYVALSDKIWAFAETAFEEGQSSKVLSDFAEQQGFKVERGVAGLPTAFIATYGSGKPVIGILGEFDALPGLSQKAEPTKNPLNEGSPGHGCGHNLFGVGSLGAAIAIKEQMDAGKIKGTIKFFGTPAEEKFFGKLFMARAGLFDGLDASVDWHPGAQTESNVQSGLSLVDFLVEFEGQAAHAAGDPWNGRSASDGMELFTTGINYLREHIKPSVRIHYHMMNAGDVVNVVPDYSKIWTRVRDTHKEDMLLVYERVKEIARGAAIMANVDYKITLISGVHETLVNRAGGAIMQQNLELLGPIIYTDSEVAFARKIQEVTGKEQTGLDADIKPLRETLDHPGGGSSDVGDVSWIVPEVRLSVTTAPIDTPWHSWAVVACGGMSIGHKGMMQAAKALALTMSDLYNNSSLLESVKMEFKERKGNYQYEPILPEGPAPIPGRE